MKSLMQRWKNTEEAKNMYEKIINSFPNLYLKEILSKYLLNQEKYSSFFTKYSLNNEILLSDEKKDIIFHIIVSPSIDNIDHVYIFIGNDENNEELVYKLKEDNKILFESRKVMIIKGPSDKIYQTKTEVKRQTYIDYDLRYEYSLFINNVLNTYINNSNTILKETYIDLDKWAIRRTVTIKEDSDEPVVTLYTEADDYKSECFNNISYSKHLCFINNDMRPSTKERYEEAINGANNIVVLKK